ncbi:Alpha/Beta hydrolase protein [Cantharellus anzutake]|uniref:Alpha/Beta hydrolase protein n=1 Tax=Cantharellus anzutake TaxID=1750568 RepID=UPI00190406E0|nr:Alpha/Beta hydrolase protein [Cantharellus anzutake]KAF8339653.1 Alpha/Beta hydrolase protein [Cantharellus anzutake]
MPTSSHCVTLQTLFRSVGSVDLAFEKAEPPNGMNGSRPVVVLHGLFGQKQNWRSLSRAMAKELNTNVYALDLRNHGTSPHNQDMQYKTLASDVLHFFNTHSLSNVTLIGHSMGGKAASAVALKPDLPPNTLSSLIVVDVTPKKVALSSEFSHYAKAMKAIDDVEVRDSKAAHRILEEYSDYKIELPVRQFLLTNLGVVDGVRKFRIPLDIITSQLHEVSWDGPTLAISGLRSNYIRDKDIPIIKMLFPRAEFASLDASHWVHADRPIEFLQLVRGFLKKHQ